MAARNYIGALAFSTLLGCSTSPDSYSVSRDQNPSYIEAVRASPEVQSVVDSILRSSDPQAEKLDNPFAGKKVTLMYATGLDRGTPGQGTYVRPEPTDRDFFDGALRELEGRHAYVSPRYVFKGQDPLANYSQALSLSRRPMYVQPDLFVIADKNRPNLEGDLKNVYIAVEKDGKFSFVEAAK